MLLNEGILALRSVKVGASSSSCILQPNDRPKDPRSYMLVGLTAPSQPIVVAGPPSVGHCTRLYCFLSTRPQRIYRPFGARGSAGP
jgi:hypothetical protein